MPDDARKWLEAHDKWQKNAPDEMMPMQYVKAFIAAPAAEHLRRLLEQNEMMQEALGAIVGYTYQEADQTELWVHRTAKKALDA